MLKMFSVKRTRHYKTTGKWEKNAGKSGNFVRLEKGKPCETLRTENLKVIFLDRGKNTKELIKNH